MPFIDDPVPAGLLPSSPAPLDITVPSPPFSRLFDSAMRRDNIVGSITEAATQPPMGAFDPSFDPWTKIEGYEDYARSFIGAHNDEDVLHIKARIDKERRDEETLSSGGWRGAVAQLAAGALDPTMLLPAGGQVRAITRGGRALEGLVRGGAAFGAGTALQETGLQGSQITRPISESLLNIGSATVLGGVLGGAVGALTRPTTRMLGELGDSAAAGTAVFDRELAANLPGRRPDDVPAQIIDAPTVERAIADTFAVGGDTSTVYDGIAAHLRRELAGGTPVAHVDQGGERTPIVAIDSAGRVTDATGAQLRLDEITAPGHSIEIQARPFDQPLDRGPFVDDPLALFERGALTAERAAEIAALPPEDVARVRAAGVPLDPEMWNVVAENLTKAEASREGGVGVVADQLGYLQAGGASEREAVAVIGRSMQLEAERGGDAARLLDDAIIVRFGDEPPAWLAERKQQLLDAGTTPAPLQGGIAGAEYRKLIAAGVPEEEARLTASLTRARYEARASRDRGGRTAEALYRAEAAEHITGEPSELRAGELGQAPSETKGHPEGEAEDAAWRRLEPEKTADGKYHGAPEDVTTPRHLGRLRRLIQQLIAEGTPGRFWYEDSARRIIQITRGNLAEAEKLMGLVAIYSPQMPVFGNTSLAIKAYGQWKRGEPIRVKTGAQDARAAAWLERGEDWGGRKTNNFYINLMHELVTEYPEAIKDLNIPAAVLTEIKGATVDLWVLRALGYRVDAAGGVRGGGGAANKYGFSEREIQRAAGMLNKDLAPGERRWLPHQVQAALWSAIKARYELPEVKKATIAESLQSGFSKMVTDEKGITRWEAPAKNGAERQGHMEVWRKHALAASPEDVARQIETAKGSFGDAIDRIAQNVTAEAIPTSTLGHAINNASLDAKLQFTREALALILDDDGNDTLAAQLGVNLNFNRLGTGAYAGDLNPNVVTTLVPEKPAGFFDSTKARQYARAWQYIYKQDAVPFFRAETAYDFKGDYSVLNESGKVIRKVDTQRAAQAYADRRSAAGNPSTIKGGDLSFGEHLVFSQDLDEAAQRRLLSALQEELGPDVGFTKTGDRDIVVVNYRDQNGLPSIDDVDFGNAIDRIAARDDLGIEKVSHFGSEGEYGPVHDWQGDPSGAALAEAAGGSPALQSWIRDRAEAFERLLDDWRDPESRVAAAEPRPAGEPGAEPRADGEPGAPRGPPELEQAGRGKIRRFTEEARALITRYRDAADASTLIHENFHDWVDQLFRDAARSDAHPQLLADVETLRREVGAREGEELTTQQLEQLAQWGEQYLREGRAPSPELEGVFARFREWLLDIYKTITELGVPINDDVRGVFDRMFTPEERARGTAGGEAPTGGSVGAARVLDTSLDQETISGALGVEKALVRTSPTLRAGTSPLIETRRIANELADQPLDLKKNIEGIPTAQSVESLIKQFKAPLAEAEVGVDEAFVRYRLGRAKRKFDIARLEMRDMFGRPQGAMSYDEFREAVSRAMRRGDQSPEPDVAAAAKLLREKVFDPLKDRAIAAGLLPDGVEPGTALSYLMRLYDTNKIVAQRGQFADVITRWLSGEQAKKDTIRTRITDLLDEFGELTARVRRREGQIAGRERALRDTEIRREEASRFNAFAYRRATNLSAPVDQLRTDIGAIEAQIRPHLDRLEELRTAIAAEKDKFPEIREIDAAMYRLIGAGQKLRQGGELVDLVRDSEAVVKAIDDVRASVRGGIRELSEQRVGARLDLGAVDLVALEKARTDIGKTIRPYRKELQRLQRQLKREMRTRGGPARGGAVFETAIRRRGNVLADQASGREAAIETLGARHARDQERIGAIQGELEELVKSWEGTTSQRAKAALARRAEAEATRTPEQGRLQSADKPVVKAAKAISGANTRLEEIELRDIARQIIDRIIGSPVGRLPYDMEVPTPRGGPPGQDRAPPRGPLAGRAFMIPDELIEPWLENDSRQITRAYERTMAPDVLLAERFGRTDMQSQFQQIQAGYERLRVGKSEAEQKTLNAAMQSDLRDLAAMRDRMRGTYGLPENPNGLGNRIYHVVRDLNYLRLLGGMTVSAFPDMGRIVMQHGFNRVFGDALVPMLKSFREFRLAAGEAKLAGTALDMVLDTRAMSMADMLDDYGRWSKYERGLKGLTDKFGLVSLMAPWNAAMKQIAGVMGQTRTLEVIEDLVAGRAVRQAERTRLASLGIGPDMAERIDAMFKAHGAKQENGSWWANTEAWTDRGAIEAFRSALNKEIDTTVVTQGQEVPLWMSRGIGRLIGQFKSFSMASTQRVMMSGLQKRDMATLNGAMMMTGLGMLVYYLRTEMNPHAQPLPDPSTPGGVARWLREGVDIAGLTGWLFDVHNVVEKATSGGIGLSRLTGGPAQSRYANRNTLESILGPTAGLIQDAGQLIGATTKGEWSAGDSSRVRRMIPFQNLIGVRHLFDAAEHGLNHALGVREPTPPR